jgi:hypothetical protein
MQSRFAIIAMFVISIAPGAGFACQKGQAVSIAASAYTNSLNVCVNCVRTSENPGGYGVDLVMNNGSKDQSNMAAYYLDMPESGRYVLSIAYAAGASRSAQLFINNNIQPERILSDVTGGWSRPFIRYIPQGVYYFNAGLNKLGIERESYFPHLYDINLTCVD